MLKNILEHIKKIGPCWFAFKIQEKLMYLSDVSQGELSNQLRRSAGRIFQAVFPCRDEGGESQRIQIMIGQSNEQALHKRAVADVLLREYPKDAFE